MPDLAELALAAPVLVAVGWFARGVAHRWQVRRMAEDDRLVANVEYWTRVNDRDRWGL